MPLNAHQTEMLPKNLVKILAVGFLISSNVFAQENHHSINCDSLLSLFDHDVCLVVEELPSPLKPYDEIMNEFVSKVDTNLLMKNIYVKVVIDTNGNALCPQVINGNSNVTDSIAMEYISQLKFTPANARGRKLPVAFVIPLKSRNETETNTMIKVNGKWKLKK